MKSKTRYHSKTFILICITCQHFALDIKDPRINRVSRVNQSSRVNRVVFKTIPFPADDTVQCYDRCDKKTAKTSIRCEGRKLQFGCQRNNQIDVYQATSYKVIPDVDISGKPLDICVTTQISSCLKNVTSVVRTVCNGVQQCTVDVTNDQLQNQCKDDKFIAMDILFICRFKRQDNTITSPLTTKVTSPLDLQTSIMVKIGGNVLKTEMPGLAKLSTGMKEDVSKTVPSSSQRPANVLVPTSQGETAVNEKSSRGMFWLLSAYTAIYDSELLKANIMEWAMIVLLSLIVGCIVYVSVYIHRWWRLKFNNLGKDSIREYHPDSQSNNHKQPKVIENIKSNESLLQYDILPCTEESCGEFRYKNGELHSNTTTTMPVLKEIDERRTHTMNNVEQIQRQPQPNESSPLSFSHQSVSTGKCSSPILISMDTLPNEKDTLLIDSEVIYERNNDMMDFETEEVYVEDDASNISNTIERYHASDEYSSSPQVSRQLPYHRTECYMVRPNAKIVPTINDKSDNESCIDERSICSTGTPHPRMRRCHHIDKSFFHHRNKRIDQPREKIYFTSNGKRYVLRNQKRKRHVIIPRHGRQNGELPIHDYRPTPIYSDNEASIRRKQYELAYKDGSRYHCKPTSSLRDLHSSMYEMTEKYHRDCRSSFSSQCQSSIDENLGDLDPQHAFKSNSCKKKQMKNEFSVEESGYLSYDTATDSLCSSVFSTDQEDSIMSSSPVPMATTQTNCKGRRLRHVHASRDHPCFHSLRHQKTTKVPYRFRSTCYDSPGGYRCQNRTIIDASTDLTDEATMKGHSRSLHRVQRENMKRDVLSELKEDPNFDCES